MHPRQHMAGDDALEFKEYIVDLNADCVCGCMKGDRFHKIFHFPNDYGASVVNNPKKEGFNRKGYRVLILKFSGYDTYSVVNMPLLDTSLLECEDWNGVVRALTQIKDL